MLTSYDDLVESIAEVHLSIASENIFPKMRSLSGRSIRDYVVYFSLITYCLFKMGW
jgi:hypothetical protein